MYLPELIYPSKEGGSKEITCVVCGWKGKGFDFSFSDNFVGWGFMKAGNGLCPSCYQFFKNQDIRKKHFLATTNGIQFLKKEGIRQVLNDLPEPPFFLYITQSHQKQGWIGDLNKVSMSREHFYISTDFTESAIFTSKAEVDTLFKLYDEALELGLSKTEMSTGVFKITSYQKAEKQGKMELLNRVQEKAHMPIWEVIVYVG